MLQRYSHARRQERANKPANEYQCGILGMTRDEMFGVDLCPEGLTFDDMEVWCLAAEELGYDLFTVPDHFYPMRDSSEYPLECWSILSGLAAVTKQIRLGPLVSCAGYRNPALLAKIASTVDIVSHGRLILGIGAGWHRTEYEAYFGRFPSVKERIDIFEETAAIVRSMLHQKETSFQGRYFRIEDPVNLPRPMQERIPVLIGGGGEKRTLRIAAKYADISHFGHSLNQDELARKIEVLRAHCKRVHRNPGSITIATTATPLLEGKTFPREMIEALERSVDLGVGLFTCAFENRLGLEKFAEEIIPTFR